jgi:hypothetical protein
MTAYCSKTSPAEVLAVAAVVYDQDTHNEADMNFLFAVNAADKEWADQLNAANINFGAGSEAWQATKRLATKTREVALLRAYAEFEAEDFPEFDDSLGLGSAKADPDALEGLAGRAPNETEIAQVKTLKRVDTPEGVLFQEAAE